MKISDNPNLSLLSQFQPSNPVLFCDVCDIDLKSKDYFCKSCGVGVHLECLANISRYNPASPKCPKCYKLDVHPEKIAKYLCTICNDPCGLLFKKCDLIRPHVPLMNSENYVHASCLASCARSKPYTNYSNKLCDLCDLPMEISSVSCKQTGCAFQVHYRCLQLAKREYRWASTLTVSDVLDIEFECPAHEKLPHIDKIIERFRCEYQELFKLVRSIKNQYQQRSLDRELPKFERKLQQQQLMLQEMPQESFPVPQQVASPAQMKFETPSKKKPTDKPVIEINDSDTLQSIEDNLAQPVQMTKKSFRQVPPNTAPQQFIPSQRIHSSHKNEKIRDDRETFSNNLMGSFKQLYNPTIDQDIKLESPMMPNGNSPKRNGYQPSINAPFNKNNFEGYPPEYQVCKPLKSKSKSVKLDYDSKNQLPYSYAPVPASHQLNQISQPYDHQFQPHSYQNYNDNLREMALQAPSHQLPNTYNQQSFERQRHDYGNMPANNYSRPKSNQKGLSSGSGRRQTGEPYSWYEPSNDNRQPMNDNFDSADRQQARFMVPGYGFEITPEKPSSSHRLKGLPPIQANAFGYQKFRQADDRQIQYQQSRYQAPQPNRKKKGYN